LPGPTETTVERTGSAPGRGRAWRWVLLAAAASLALLGAAWRAGWVGRPEGGASRPPSAAGVLPGVGQLAPDFTLPLLDAGSSRSPRVLALHALRGRPVVLNFWASWCAPCRAETPLLVQAAQAVGRRVVFVGVNVEDAPGDARRFVEEYRVPYPVVRSSDERVIRAYNIIGLPTTVFIDREGRIQAEHVGGFTGPDGERALWKQLATLTAEP
jgi:cytochrome c biogenesis protein CcmG/thiol:disulfide interchange protein DsbE